MSSQKMADPKPERIRLLHPDPLKKGVNIERSKFEQMHAAIQQLLKERETIGFSEAMTEIGNRLTGKFEGKIGWYYVSVKLHMEATGELIRIPGSGKQMMRKA
jgi:hypothetical protein